MSFHTALTLIGAGLKRADEPDSPTGFIEHASTFSEAHDFLNAALSEMWDVMLEADSESYALVKNPFNSIVGQSDYTIFSFAGGNQFYRLRAMEWFNGQRWIGLKRLNFSQRNDYPFAGQPCGYALEGDNIIIYPAPNVPYQMRSIYIPTPPTVTSDADTVDLKGPWREYVEIHFAIQCLEKGEKDSSKLEMRKAALIARIRNASKRRDSGQPIHVVDVVGNCWRDFY